MKRFICLMLLLIFQFLPQASEARIFINVDEPSGQRLPVALVPILPLEGSPDPLFNQFIPILERDLALTGLFRFISRASFLESKKAGITAEETNFSLWRKSGADALIKGGYRKVGGTYTLEVRLFDVQQRSLILGKRYHFTEDKFRTIVHTFADQILLKLTGESGVFAKTKIAAIVTNGKFKELFQMDVDGHNMVQLTHHGSIVLSPDWSRDGRMIGFTSFANGNPDFYLFDRKKSRDRRISSRPGLNLGASFSPVANEIILAVSNDSDAELVRMNYKGKIKENLTKNWWIDIEPTYAPDGKNIAFVHNKSGQPHVYRMNLENREVKRLTYKGYHNVSPNWSPRNNKIAFAGKDQGWFDIFIMNTDGTGIQRLTRNHNNESPSWSPNGQMIVFNSNRNGKNQLYVMGADGSGQVQITDGIGEYTHAAWSPWLHD